MSSSLLALHLLQPCLLSLLLPQLELLPLLLPLLLLLLLLLLQSHNVHPFPLCFQALVVAPGVCKNSHVLLLLLLLLSSQTWSMHVLLLLLRKGPRKRGYLTVVSAYPGPLPGCQ